MKLTTALMSALGVVAIPAAPSSLATWAGIITGVLSLPVPSGMAYAADVNGPIPYKAPPINPPSWTGFYGGVEGGYTWGENDQATNVTSDPFTVNGVNVTTSGGGGGFLPINPPINIGSWTTPGTFQLQSRGAIIGGRIGGDYQPAGTYFVLGLVGAWDWTNWSGSETLNQPAPPFAFNVAGLTHGLVNYTNNGAMTVNQSEDWRARINARFGFLLKDNWLLYGFVGGAFTNASLSGGAFNQIAASFNPGHGLTANAQATFSLTGSCSSTLTGWDAGVGTEIRLTDHWSVFAEWTHTDYGSLSCPLLPMQQASFTASAGGRTLTVTPTLVPQAPGVLNAEFRDDAVITGFHYRF